MRVCVFGYLEKVKAPFYSADDVTYIHIYSVRITLGGPRSRPKSSRLGNSVMRRADTSLSSDQGRVVRAEDLPVTVRAA